MPLKLKYKNENKQCISGKPLLPKLPKWHSKQQLPSTILKFQLKYYLKLKNFESILIELQAEIQDRVDGLQVNQQVDPEAPVNPPQA